MNKHQVSLKEYLIPKIQAIFPEFELFNIPFTSQEHLDIEGIESFVVQLDSLNQLKVFFEGFVVGKILIGFDVYRSLGYNLIRYDYFKTKTEKPGLNVFTKSKNGFGVVVNLAYRIRID